jgi:hypothetical protein
VGYPTSFRQKGDRVVSKFDITASSKAPAEPSTARVGLYVYPQVLGVPVVDQQGQPVSDAVVFELESEEQ